MGKNVERKVNQKWKEDVGEVEAGHYALSIVNAATGSTLQMLSFLFVCLFVFTRGSLDILLGRPGIHNVAQAGLELAAILQPLSLPPKSCS